MCDEEEAEMCVTLVTAWWKWKSVLTVAALRFWPGVGAAIT